MLPVLEILTDSTFKLNLQTMNQHNIYCDLYIVGKLTLRLLMSYIYMEHQFLMFLDDTRRRTTVGRTPLDE